MREERDVTTSALVKLLIGACFAVTVMATMAVFGLLSTDSRRLDRQQRLAHAACCNALEAIRGLPFEAVQGLHGRGFDVPGIDGEPRGLPILPGDSDGLAGRFSITVDAESGDHVVYRVTLNVEWGSQRNQHEHAITGLITSRTGP